MFQGCPVVARTAGAQNPSGSVTAYRRFNKPGYGPLGDSSDELT